MTTVLVQVEAIMNSRPLTPLSEDPDDLDVLTRGHFLTGSSLLAIPDPDYTNVPTNRLEHYQQLQQLFQQHWKRWRREFRVPLFFLYFHTPLPLQNPLYKLVDCKSSLKSSAEEGKFCFAIVSKCYSNKVMEAKNYYLLCAVLLAFTVTCEVCEPKVDNLLDYISGSRDGAQDCHAGRAWEVYSCPPLTVLDRSTGCERLRIEITRTGRDSGDATESTLDYETSTDPTTESHAEGTESTEGAGNSTEATSKETSPTTIKGTTLPTTQDPTVTTDRTPEPVSSCEKIANGKIPYPPDCKQYIHCKNKHGTLTDCYTGYIFYEPFQICLPGDTKTCELYSLGR
ncbi:uncharacterized protein LOC129765716 [Toxorhynchites rutilus septentrionalis]|uniref:uncharacterized protein LOC129765716 n=1 Tax=Toxorhynchites rutilus septentrionalis TaxID=329112 RepID=UPI002478DE75|nr:uncharacterized protein LOC129765716 [Toxorhynchites rutilus septentrionalis]